MIYKYLKSLNLWIRLFEVEMSIFERIVEIMCIDEELKKPEPEQKPLIFTAVFDKRFLRRVREITIGGLSDGDHSG